MGQFLSYHKNYIDGHMDVKIYQCMKPNRIQKSGFFDKKYMDVHMLWATPFVTLPNYISSHPIKYLV